MHASLLEGSGRCWACHRQKSPPRVTASGYFLAASEYPLKPRRSTTVLPGKQRKRALCELAAAIAIEQRDFTEALQHVRALILLEPEREIHQRRLQAINSLIKRSESELPD